ncbi:unnamed protein product [Colias eurytheme]|nr:unnamed protein product [Colias eurytheme]
MHPTAVGQAIRPWGRSRGVETRPSPRSSTSYCTAMYDIHCWRRRGAKVGGCHGNRCRKLQNRCSQTTAVDQCVCSTTPEPGKSSCACVHRVPPSRSTPDQNNLNCDTISIGPKRAQTSPPEQNAVAQHKVAALYVCVIFPG